MNKTLALVLAGGTGDRLSILSEERAKPAVVFGGKYRIIDFTLSNCVNSGVCRVGVLTQYQPRSLQQHLGLGAPWELDRSGHSLFLLQPFMARGGSSWYKGTADAVYQNLIFVEESLAEQIFVLAGDHVYRMNYQDMLAYHKVRRAEVTVGVVSVSGSEAHRFGMMEMDKEGAVVGFEEKPAVPKGSQGSMGIYIFNRGVLIKALEEDARKENSTHDFGRDVIPSLIGRHRVYGYFYEGYWRDVGTIEAYWQANMDLVVDLPELNLYEQEAPLITRDEFRPPVKTGPHARISRSLVCGGCIINGEVYNSVLSPGVYVERGALVTDSIIFHDSFISRDVVVHRSIIDKEVWVGPGCHIGFGEDYTPSHEEPEHLKTGITLVGKKARIPARTGIGRNCKIAPGVQEQDFPSSWLASGASVHKIK